MKKILLLLAGIVTLSIPVILHAQTATFNLSLDTVTATVVKTGHPTDNIVNITANNLTLKWHVLDASDFPSDWLTPVAFGICDNFLCRYNLGNVLWNESTHSGSTITSTYSANSAHEDTGSFYLSLDLSNATSLGTHWVSVSITDSATGYSKTITFVINKLANSVPTVTNIDDKTTLYPNPANNELNIVYDANADVKNIAVYNVIGKIMTVYKVTGNSANLNIESIPSGIYFVRLFNSNGNVVVTRKFTKQ